TTESGVKTLESGSNVSRLQEPTTSAKRKTPATHRAARTHSRQTRRESSAETIGNRQADRRGGRRIRRSNTAEEINTFILEIRYVRQVATGQRHRKALAYATLYLRVHRHPAFFIVTRNHRDDAISLGDIPVFENAVAKGIYEHGCLPLLVVVRQAAVHDVVR